MVRANWEMTVSVSDGTCFLILPAEEGDSQEKDAQDDGHPNECDARVAALPAFLKAVMPLEMASTPVNVVVPLEKACKIKNRLIA